MKTQARGLAEAFGLGQIGEVSSLDAHQAY
jgi:hypothetical protein